MNIAIIAQILSREYSRMYGAEITVQIKTPPTDEQDR